jgi:RNA polymerase sigma-70 factor (ECF subfamily)
MYEANGVVVVAPTPAGVSRVIAFHDDPALVVMFGCPEVLAD